MRKMTTSYLIAVFLMHNTWLSKSIPDELYLKLIYKGYMNKPLDLENPNTFNEKLQWLKLHDRKMEYSAMVDKYEAKNYVRDRIGEEYIIPTYGVWDSFEDINFDVLPNQFVLKCTHDSGGLAIVRDKKIIDKEAIKKKIKKSLKTNFYFYNREWPYKEVKPRILAEAYMKDGENSDLRDYKFYCFNGLPRFLYISEGLENHKTARISFVTPDWQFASYERSDYSPFDKLPERPEKLDEMLDIASRLSMGHLFLRVDLYQINGKVYFSELTFSPCGGLMPFKNPQDDIDIGKMLKLPCQ